MTAGGLEAGIVTTDGAGLAAFYVEGLGFTIDRLLEFPQGTVRRLSNGAARLKILEPAEPVAGGAPDPWNAVAGFRYAAMAERVAADFDGLDTLTVAPGSFPRGDAATLPSSAAPGDGDVRWLTYTSGTTADPKGARHADSTVGAFPLAMSRRLEDVLFAWSDVADVAVFGIPDDRTGERVAAIVPAGGARPTVDSVADFLRGAGLRTRAIPESVELRESLPRNPAGKVLKRLLQSSHEP